MSKSTALTVRRSPPTAAVTMHYEPLNLDQLFTLAKELVPTGFLPEHIKTPGQCCAIILAGRELGMDPMRSLRSLVMVKGKVTEAADSQLARFKTDGGRAKFTELTDARAVLWLRHPNGDEHTETFSIEDAKRAGLTSNTNYQKYPKPMLRSRCITAGLKSLGWEGGAGVYDPAELDATPAVVAETRPEVKNVGGLPANDEQRAQLKAFGEMVHVFTREQCDSFDDNAARADLSAQDAATAIAWAKKKVATWEAAQPVKAAEPEFQDDRALAD